MAEAARWARVEHEVRTMLHPLSSAEVPHSPPVPVARVFVRTHGARCVRVCAVAFSSRGSCRMTVELEEVRTMSHSPSRQRSHVLTFSCTYPHRRSACPDTSTQHMVLATAHTECAQLWQGFFSSSRGSGTYHFSFTVHRASLVYSHSFSCARPRRPSRCLDAWCLHQRVHMSECHAQ